MKICQDQHEETQADDVLTRVSLPAAMHDENMMPGQIGQIGWWPQQSITNTKKNCHTYVYSL